MSAGKDREVHVSSFLVKLGDSRKGVTSFVFHEADGGNLARHLHDEFHTHVSGGLNEERQTTGIGNGGIVLLDLVQIEIVAAAGGKRDDRVGLQRVGVSGEPYRRRCIRGLNAEDNRGPETLGRTDDRLGPPKPLVQ